MFKRSSFFCFSGWEEKKGKEEVHLNYLFVIFVSFGISFTARTSDFKADRLVNISCIFFGFSFFPV